MKILKKAGRVSARAMARSAAILVGTLGIVCGSTAWAADYPNGPVTLVIPFSAGGSTDVIARVIARESGQALERVLADIERDHWMPAEEAVAYGLVSRIIEKRGDLA